MKSPSILIWGDLNCDTQNNWNGLFLHFCHTVLVLVVVQLTVSDIGLRGGWLKKCEAILQKKCSEMHQRLFLTNVNLPICKWESWFTSNQRDCSKNIGQVGGNLDFNISLWSRNIKLERPQKEFYMRSSFTFLLHWTFYNSRFEALASHFHTVTVCPTSLEGKELEGGEKIDICKIVSFCLVGADSRCYKI